MKGTNRNALRKDLKFGVQASWTIEDVPAIGRTFSVNESSVLRFLMTMHLAMDDSIVVADF